MLVGGFVGRLRLHGRSALISRATEFVNSCQLNSMMGLVILAQRTVVAVNLQNPGREPRREKSGPFKERIDRR